MRATRSANIQARLELDTEHRCGFSERPRDAFFAEYVVQALAGGFNCLAIERHRTCDRTHHRSARATQDDRAAQTARLHHPIPSSSRIRPSRQSTRSVKPFAFDGNTATVERCAEPCGQRRRDALGRRNEDHAAIAFRQHAARKHGPPGAQGRGKVEAAKQPIVIDRGWNFPDRHVRTQHRAERRDETVTPLARRRPHNQAAKRKPDRPRTCMRPAPHHRMRPPGARSCSEHVGHDAIDARRRADFVERIAAQSMSKRNRGRAPKVLRR